MLASASTLNQAILALTPSVNQHAALVAFVNVIGNFMDQVQAGPTGAPSILKINRPVFVAQLETQHPVATDAWISNFADAWFKGVSQGTITPGTVVNPAWTASGVDVATVPSPSTTIATLNSAKSLLITKLSNVKPDNTAALPMANALRDATLSFVFLCVGLAVPGTPVPIPLPAQ